MPLDDFSMYRRREDIVAEMLANLVAAIPDAYTGEDGVTRIIFEIDAGQLENLYLAHQILLEDVFIPTASSTALTRHGEEYGLSMKIGTSSVGTLRFEGDGGTYVNIGAEVAYDPSEGLDVIYFNTTTDGTIPNPGDPDAPDTVINAAAGNLNGIYEYQVTFVTASGETLPSTESAAVNPVDQQVDLSAIPLGGAGTTARRIYRDKDGAGIYRLVEEIADNVTVAWTDNVTDAAAAAGALAPTVDTAHRVEVQGIAQSPGLDGNVIIGAITELTNAPATLTGVTNTTAFIGGTDPEDTEDFRNRLLRFVRSPGTGAPDDLKAWAETIEGVDSATVFTNTPGPGETTVRIAGPNGTIPTADTITATQNLLDALDLANVTIHVETFNPVPTDIDVDVTPSGSYTLDDVTDSVETAISDYIDSLDVGETLRVAGIIDAVFGLPGIDDVVVTTPADNLVTDPGDKRTPGTISVT